MKIQIRRGVFETNSSSTHSICISKKPVEIDTKRHIFFQIGDYGWENDTEYNVQNYLYTAIMTFDDHAALMEQLKEILDKYKINYTFGPAEITTMKYKDTEYSYLDNGGIDHSGETRDFVEAVLDNEDMLMRLLFGDSVVYTGNDNSDHEPDGKNIAEEEYYDSDSHQYVTNPYHDSANYDYFYKGN